MVNKLEVTTSVLWPVRRQRLPEEWPSRCRDTEKGVGSRSEACHDAASVGFVNYEPECGTLPFCQWQGRDGFMI